MSAQAQGGQAQGGQAQGAKVGFSSTVGQGTTHAAENYNRRPGARGPSGPGSPNFTGYFKPPGAQGSSNMSGLSAAMGGMTLGQGGRRRTKKNKNKKKRKRSRKN